MTVRSRRFVFTFLALSLSSIVFAQAPALDVKMGLWELTSKVTMGGQMPFDTSKLSPEQRAQVEASLKSSMGTHTTVNKTCMTKEKFDKSNFMSDMPGMTCTQTITTNTRSTLEASGVCTGGTGSMTMQMRFDAQSPTAVTGTMKGASTSAGKTLTTDATISGKWLGADCGSTK